MIETELLEILIAISIWKTLDKLCWVIFRRVKWRAASFSKPSCVLGTWQCGALLIHLAFPIACPHNPCGMEELLFWGGYSTCCWLFPMRGAVCVVGCSRDSAVTTAVVRLALVPRNPPSIRCSLGAASAVCKAAGQLEEGRCLLIRGPLLQAQSQFVASYRRLVLLFGLPVFKWHIAATDLSFRVMVFWPPGVVF